jgi:hypothetical protein
MILWGPSAKLTTMQTILVFSGLLMVSNTFGPHNEIDRPTIRAPHNPLAYHYLFQIVCNKFEVMDDPSPPVFTMLE